MNAFTIPTKSVMHGAKIRKNATPAPHQHIVLAPRLTHVDRVIRDTFGSRLKPARRRDDVRNP